MKYRQYVLKDLLAQDAWIRDLAHRLVLDEDSAQDVVQDAWVKVLETPRMKSGASRSWLRRVVRNLAFMRYRANAHQKKRERAVARSERIPSVGEIQEREEARIQVTRAVFSLEEPYRSAILYRYFENLPPREISALLGVSSQAVEGRLRRGLQKLRARLDREFGGRKSWCTALLPLIARASSEVAAGAATASLLTGALIMSTKVKIGIAVIAALGVAYAFWPRDDKVDLPGSETVKSTPTTNEKAAESESAPGKEVEVAAKVAEKEPEAQAAPISLEPARGSIVGVVTDQNRVPIPNATVRAFRFSPGAVELKELISTRTDERGRYVLKPLEDRSVVEASAARHNSRRCFANPFTRMDFVLGKPGVLRGGVFIARDGSPGIDATVAVYAETLADALNDRYALRRPPTAVSHTDQTGAYRFEALAPGRYHVNAMLTDGRQACSRSNDVEIFIDRETVRDLVVGSGYDLEGRVIDKGSGRGVSGAEVYLWNNRRKRCMTEEGGRYELAAVSLHESASAIVRARGYVQYGSGLVFASKGIGSRIVQDFQVLRGTVLTGRVLGPDGNPVAGAFVGTSPLSMRVQDEFSIMAGSERTITDERGRFEVTTRSSHDSVIPKRPLYAHKPGLAWAATPPMSFGIGEEKTGIVIHLKRGGSISGRITDDRGEPVDSAQVLLDVPAFNPATRDTYYFSRRSVYSRTDGRYDIDGVPEGTYRIEVVPAGRLGTSQSRFAHARLDRVQVSSGRCTQANVSLSVGQAISGRVVDGDGVPVVGAAIWTAMFPPYGNASYRLQQMRWWAFTDAQGMFKVEGLSDVEVSYMIRVSKAGFSTATVGKIEGERSGLVFTLHRIKTVTGQVVYEASGRPVTEFSIEGAMLSGPGGTEPPRPTRSTRPSGVFADLGGRFSLQLQPGRYELAALSPDGQRSTAGSVELPEVGAAAPVLLVVSRGATLFGVVQIPSGRADTSSSVEVWHLDVDPPKKVRRMRTDQHGRFEIRSLPVGKLVLYGETRRSGARYGGALQVVTRTGPRQEVKLVVRPFTRVEVLVTNNDEKPIQGANVRIVRTDGAGFALDHTWLEMRLTYSRERMRANQPPTRAKAIQFSKKARRMLSLTDAEGKLPPLKLLPGEYVIQVTAPGYKPWKKTVRITSGAKQTVMIRLKGV